MPEASDERVGTAADCAGDVTRSPERGVEAHESQRDDDNGHAHESKASWGDRKPAETQCEHAECSCEDDDTATVRSCLAPADRHQREGC